MGTVGSAPSLPKWRRGKAQEWIPPCPRCRGGASCDVQEGKTLPAPHLQADSSSRGTTGPKATAWGLHQRPLPSFPQGPGPRLPLPHRQQTTAFLGVVEVTLTRSSMCTTAESLSFPYGVGTRLVAELPRKAGTYGCLCPLPPPVHLAVAGRRVMPIVTDSLPCSCTVVLRGKSHKALLLSSRKHAHHMWGQSAVEAAGEPGRQRRLLWCLFLACLAKPAPVIQTALRILPMERLFPSHGQSNLILRVQADCEGWEGFPSSSVQHSDCRHQEFLQIHTRKAGQWMRWLSDLVWYYRTQRFLWTGRKEATSKPCITFRRLAQHLQLPFGDGDGKSNQFDFYLTRISSMPEFSIKYIMSKGRAHIRTAEINTAHALAPPQLANWLQKLVCCCGKNILPTLHFCPGVELIRANSQADNTKATNIRNTGRSKLLRHRQIDPFCYKAFMFGVRENACRHCNCARVRRSRHVLCNIAHTNACKDLGLPHLERVEARETGLGLMKIWELILLGSSLG